MDLRENKGILFGFFAATVFAFTLPTTRFAVDYFHPIFLGAGRSALAGFVAMALLAITRQPLPKANQLKELIEQGEDYEKVGNFASYAAGQVVTRLGPRLKLDECRSIKANFFPDS